MDSAEKTANKSAVAKKVVSWVLTGISILFLLMALFFLIASIVARKKDNRAVEIFGYSFSIVQTDSMTGEIEVGELITVKICTIEKAEIGTSAVYIAASGPLIGHQIVHKVIEVGADENGTYIVTQGVKEGAPVDDPVYSEQFVGIVVRHSMFWGRLAKFFATPINWLLILTVIVGIPCIYLLVKLIIRYNKEAKKEKEEKKSDREK